MKCRFFIPTMLLVIISLVLVVNTAIETPPIEPYEIVTICSEGWCEDILHFKLDKDRAYYDYGKDYDLKLIQNISCPAGGVDRKESKVYLRKCYSKLNLGEYPPNQCSIRYHEEFVSVSDSLREMYYWGLENREYVFENNSEKEISKTPTLNVGSSSRGMSTTRDLRVKITKDGVYTIFYSIELYEEYYSIMNCSILVNELEVPNSTTSFSDYINEGRISWAILELELRVKDIIQIQCISMGSSGNIPIIKRLEIAYKEPTNFASTSGGES